MSQKNELKHKLKQDIIRSLKAYQSDAHDTTKIVIGSDIIRWINKGLFDLNIDSEHSKFYLQEILQTPTVHQCTSF